MTRLTINTIVLAAACLTTSLLHGAINTPSGFDIMEKVKWRADGDNRQSTLDITLTEKDGYTRKRQVSYFEKDFEKDRKTFLYVNEPADVRSTAILINSYDESKVKDDDIWLYIPALRKIKRLSSRNKQGRFVGSEFIFADIERLQLRDYDYEYLGTETINQRPSLKIDAYAASDRTTEKTGYSQRTIWVDSERFVVLKEQYFDAQGVLLKELTTNTVEQISDYWIATEQTLNNVQSGRTTHLKINSLKFDDAKLSDRLFSKQSLKRGPR